MRKEPRQEMPSPGSLYVIGMPVGHRDDVTVRALRVLKTMHIVAAKDTHAAQRLLTYHGIRTTITTYDRQNAWEKAPVLLDRLRKGDSVALISDSGTPTLYDPGSTLIQLAYRAGIRVMSLPGPSALTATLAIAGMPADVVHFRGRFPVGAEPTKRVLTLMRKERCLSVFFVPAKRVRHVLRLILTRVGNRSIVIAIDLTKPSERVLRGKIRDLLTQCAYRYTDAAVTLVVGAK